VSQHKNISNNRLMETIYFQGTPCHTYGNIPAVGSEAPGFKLVDKDLKDLRSTDYKGKRIVLNIFPSLDTPVCAMSVRRFNKEASALDNVAVGCVSMDFGLQMIDGPLAGLLARAVIVIDENGKVVFSDLVNEITHEPDYEGAISVLR